MWGTAARTLRRASEHKVDGKRNQPRKQGEGRLTAKAGAAVNIRLPELFTEEGRLVNHAA